MTKQLEVPAEALHMLECDSGEWPTDEDHARAIAKSMVAAELRRLADEISAEGSLMAGGHVVVNGAPRRLRRRARELDADV